MVDLKTKTNKNQKTGREKEDERDMLSELPDDVLLHIMHFMNTKTAVGTSLLSKRWNNVWKCLTTLCFSLSDFKTLASYDQFVNHIVSQRDTSIGLHRLDFEACDIKEELLHLVPPLLHDVPHLSIHLHTRSLNMFNYSIPFLFFSHSLTSLTLSIDRSRRIFILPQPIQLPALRTLNLTNVGFVVMDSDECVEPFSSCLVLDSLVLEWCYLTNPWKVLSISNPNLSRCTMKRYSFRLLLSTPNLTYLAIGKSMFPCEVSSTCDLALLQEADIDITCDSHAIVLRLLKMLSYVKILTLSEPVLKTILLVSYFFCVFFFLCLHYIT
ncbi:hypothetical protein DEO72_LG5g2963 [Vigna unguiculata]|uniref:F-box domain-containing protein n=1 Tax=Vigna unguiculata TaxID=3917 RepID=A0A4D6M496_VIGUN|nr:hypothetical protein DEO72_LG5g2963 [Vigna unguiculata]